MSSGQVALLVIDNDLCRIAARSLAAKFPGLHVIVERRISRRLLLRRRLARFGVLRVFGQLAFMSFARVLRWASRRRIAEILRLAHLEPQWPQACERVAVASVNAAECIARLRQLDPDVVLVVGTRIISRAVLSAVTAPFVNYHDGITPKYRGIHGGYWAKAQGDLANFGVTAHLVDPGIDTGDVLYQARLKPTEQDNYATFSYLQIAAALPLLAHAAQDALDGALRPHKVDLPSQLWSHPTLWGYVATGLRRGAW
jgi:folate-dependent phosphoribosylglycinamide formyltransferase PurN